MVQAVSALINFSYLVRRNVIDEGTLDEIEKALDQFHEHHEIFCELSVIDTNSLPRQHSITHYPFLITQFGAPNGLCSSITESKHKEAIKNPFRRSNHNKALGQILITNQRRDKLAAACVDFKSRGMLDGPCVVGPLLDLAHSQYPINGVPPLRANSPENSRTLPQPAQHNVQRNTQCNEESDDVGAIDEVVDEPESYSEITLAKTYGVGLFFGSEPVILIRSQQFTTFLKTSTLLQGISST
jgi:hypothetical protein